MLRPSSKSFRFFVALCDDFDALSLCFRFIETLDEEKQRKQNREELHDRLLLWRNEEKRQRKRECHVERRCAIKKQTREKIRRKEEREKERERGIV